MVGTSVASADLRPETAHHYRTGVKLSIAALDAAVARLANDLDMLGEAKLQRPPAGRG